MSTSSFVVNHENKILAIIENMCGTKKVSLQADYSFSTKIEIVHIRSSIFHTKLEYNLTAEIAYRFSSPIFHCLKIVLLGNLEKQFNLVFLINSSKT